MGAEESSAAGDQDAFAALIEAGHERTSPPAGTLYLQKWRGEDNGGARQSIFRSNGSEYALLLLRWRMFLSENRYPPSRSQGHAFPEHALEARWKIMAGGNDRRAKSGERIAKIMARAGLCSRREAEAWITAGRVTVNGAVIASPALDVSARDRVTVDGKPLPQRERTRLFLYHKPRGLLTSHADARGRETIFAALPKSLPRLISVGRLDLNTEGLLLLTNDGGLARTLELPATGWLRRYRVRAHGRIRQEDLDRLREGIIIDGIRYGAIEAQLEREQGSNSWLTFAMREGKNREVKNVLGHLGLAVNRLIRVSFGPFTLGDLASGDIEE